MRALLAATATAAAIAVVTAATATAAAQAAPAATTTTRSAHIPFENCNARHVILSITVPRHAFTPAEPVTYTVRLRNTGGTTCGTALASHVHQARSTLNIGPCGILPLTVRNGRGLAVCPGAVSYNCPDEVGFRLGPHNSATTTGSWNQTEVLGTPETTQHAPPGTYRLVVGQAADAATTATAAVAVTVTLAPG